MNEVLMLLADIESGRFDIIFYALFASFFFLIVACVCSLILKGDKDE